MRSVSSRASEDAANAIKGHHAELHDALRRRVGSLASAVRRSAEGLGERDAVVEYLESEILPHARAEESTLYRAADEGSTGPLIEAMRAEHADLAVRLGNLRTATDPVAALSAASAILALFESHLAKENDQLIPALLARPGVGLDELLAGLHELVG
jgi:hypothetical protein